MSVSDDSHIGRLVAVEASSFVVVTVLPLTFPFVFDPHRFPMSYAKTPRTNRTMEKAATIRNVQAEAILSGFSGLTIGR